MLGARFVSYGAGWPRGITIGLWAVELLALPPGGQVALVGGQAASPDPFWPSLAGPVAGHGEGM